MNRSMDGGRLDDRERRTRYLLASSVFDKEQKHGKKEQNAKRILC